MHLKLLPELAVVFWVCLLFSGFVGFNFFVSVGFFVFLGGEGLFLLGVFVFCFVFLFLLFLPCIFKAQIPRRFLNTVFCFSFAHT